MLQKFPNDADRIIAAVYQKDYERLCQAIKQTHRTGNVVLPDCFGGPYGRCPLNVADHIGRLTDKEGNKYLVFEPYSASMEDLKELIKTCELSNWSFSIDGSSPHYVGRTVRFLLREKETPVREFRCVSCGGKIKRREEAVVIFAKYDSHDRPLYARIVHKNGVKHGCDDKTWNYSYEVNDFLSDFPEAELETEIK